MILVILLFPTSNLSFSKKIEEKVRGHHKRKLLSLQLEDLDTQNEAFGVGVVFSVDSKNTYTAEKYTQQKNIHSRKIYTAEIQGNVKSTIFRKKSTSLVYKRFRQGFTPPRPQQSISQYR